MDKSMYAMNGEGLSKHTSVFDDGERGQILPFWCLHTK